MDSSCPDALEDEQEGLLTALADLTELYDLHGVGDGGSLTVTSVLARIFDRIVAATNAVVERARVLAMRLAGDCWADGSDEIASSAYARLQSGLAPLHTLAARLELWVGRIPADDLVPLSASANAHRYWLDRASVRAGHRLPVCEEALLSDLAPTGRGAWLRLYETLVGRLTACVDGVEVPVALLRAEMSSPSGERRQRAYEAAQAAWESIATPTAACLNALAGERLLVSRRRGWTGPRAESLDVNGIDAAIFDAANSAVCRVLLELHRFARAKARLLGHDGLLPWWDLTASHVHETPMLWADAVTLICDAFGRFSPLLANHAHHAANSGWVDAQLRPGKRPTGVCIPLRAGESRLLVSYDGSYDSVLSLAHELGHSYHYHLLGSCTEFQRASPLLLQEVPSQFCVSLLALGVSSAPPEVESVVLGAVLTNMFRTAAGCFARYLFEETFLAARADGPLTPSQICDLQARIHRAVYGDSIRSDTIPAYAWAAQPHYYTGGHSGWPYYVALLLSAGLFNHASNPAADFDDFLAHTGIYSPVDLASRLGADLTSKTFWAAATATVTARVDRLSRSLLIRVQLRTHDLLVDGCFIQQPNMRSQVTP